MTENNEKIDITKCLNKMKCSIEEKKIKKRKRNNFEGIHLNFDEGEEESYGLNNIKKFMKSTEKKKRKSQTKIDPKKSGVPQTPKPKYKKMMYGFSPEPKEEELTHTSTFKKSASKKELKVRNKSVKKARKSVGKLSTSKSKL